MGAMDEPATPRTGGGHVVLCGLNELGYRTLEELARMGAEVVVVVRAAAADLAAGARALGADVRLRAMAAVVFVLMLVSVAVFARFAHLDLVDAIYFSVTIITTTVGLGSALTRAKRLHGRSLATGSLTWTR